MIKLTKQEMKMMRGGFSFCDLISNASVETIRDYCIENSRKMYVGRNYNNYEARVQCKQDLCTATWMFGSGRIVWWY